MNKLFLVGLTAALALAACESTGADTTTSKSAMAEEPDPRRGEKVDRICFASSIDGFGETTRDTIVVSTSPSKKYQIETYSCQNLDWAQAIAPLTRGGGCLSRGDRLFVSDSVFPDRRDRFGTDSCTIKAIYTWNPDAGKEEQADEEGDQDA